MIYTVTFNPSLDYFITLDHFLPGHTMRTTSEQMFPGGKGLNVSMMLKNLGIQSTCLGFTSGFVGEEIIRRFRMLSIPCDFIRLTHGCSRINVKFADQEGTEINGMGPVIDDMHLQMLYDKIRQLDDGDTLILAGSIPSSMPSCAYKDIMEMLANRRIHIAVDATKNLLLEVLPYHPFLIKPNHHELGDLFGISLNSYSQVIFYAQKLQEMGARNVLVSMGAQGAVLAAENGDIYETDAPKGTVINAVGAGDSMVAGFLAGFYESRDFFHAFKLSVAAGSASAFTEHFASKEQVMTLYHTL